MRVVAYYSQLDVNVMRRIVGPFTTLTQRGHSFFFSHITHPDRIETGNYQLIFLPNWVYGGKLPKAQGEYVYDLTDARLLDNEDAVNVIKQCHHITVPTKTLAALAKPFCTSVHVLPSLIHAEWFYSTPQPRPDVPIVACVGNFPWSTILDPLTEALKEHSDVRVVSDDEEFCKQLPAKRWAYVAADPQWYPKMVRSAYLALFPGERREMDPGPIKEFALWSVPAIAGSAWSEEVKHGETGIIADKKDGFLKAFRLLTDNDRVRVKLGSAAREAARTSTVVRGADTWARSVAKFCPTSVSSQTLK